MRTEQLPTTTWKIPWRRSYREDDDRWISPFRTMEQRILGKSSQVASRQETSRTSRVVGWFQRFWMFGSSCRMDLTPEPRNGRRKLQLRGMFILSCRVVRFGSIRLPSISVACLWRTKSRQRANRIQNGPGTPAIFVTIVLMDLEQNIPKRAKDGQAYFLFGTL